MRHKTGEIVFFAVQGGGVFPFDMLRYDLAFPASEAEDSHLLLPHETDLRTVILGRVLREPRSWQPTAGRWRSFAWVCGPAYPDEATARREAANDLRIVRMQIEAERAR